MFTAPGQATRGSHVLYRKKGCTYQKLGATCANVSDIRLPRSAIIDGVYRNPLFASGDELTCELAFQELPSLMVVEQLKPQNYPIRDVKYSHLLSSGLLGCLSEDSFQLFTAKLLWRWIVARAVISFPKSVGLLLPMYYKFGWKLFIISKLRFFSLCYFRDDLWSFASWNHNLK